jgi:SAM-dependent methyltransferase
MVSAEATRKKYRGKYAADYVPVRAPQRRWKLENDWVRQLMQDARGRVLDAPCGTGRFGELWTDLDLTAVGVDFNEDMLKQVNRGELKGGGYESLLRRDIVEYCGNLPDKAYESACCVRFLDLVEEETMRDVVRQLCRVTSDRVVLTIRLGPTYVPKSNTATHDEKRFLALVSRQKWKVDQSVPVFGQGWHVMRLQPKS